MTGVTVELLQAKVEKYGAPEDLPRSLSTGYNSAILAVGTFCLSPLNWLDTTRMLALASYREREQLCNSPVESKPTTGR